MGDKIDNLPVDDSALTTNSDIEMIGSLFQNKEQMNRLTNEFKEPIIGAILFAVLSSKYFDTLIRTTGCINELYIWGIKLIIFMIAFYILKNRF